MGEHGCGDREQVRGTRGSSAGEKKLTCCWIDTILAILSPGDTFALEGWLGGDTINANGQPGTRDWFRIDAAAPLQANVRLWIDGPALVSLNLLEWHGVEGYTLRASDFTDTGYAELTVAIDPAFAGAGLGFGIMETSNSAELGTAYRLEVTAL